MQPQNEFGASKAVGHSNQMRDQASAAPGKRNEQGLIGTRAGMKCCSTMYWTTFQRGAIGLDPVRQASPPNTASISSISDCSHGRHVLNERHSACGRARVASIPQRLMKHVASHFVPLVELPTHHDRCMIGKILVCS